MGFKKVVFDNLMGSKFFDDVTFPKILVNLYGF
jgi:hypothetical protein